MKSLFNTSWKRSKQPRRQRKFIANAPHHIKHKMLAAPLEKALQKKHNTRSLEVRKNDEVKVLRGKFKKKTGKVLTVDRKNTRINIDGLTITKKDGEKVNVWFHPSNVLITKIEDSDKKRIAKLTTKQRAAQENVKPAAKPHTT